MGYCRAEECYIGFVDILDANYPFLFASRQTGDVEAAKGDTMRVLSTANSTIDFRKRRVLE
jgi:hypothetical protein